MASMRASSQGAGEATVAAAAAAPACAAFGPDACCAASSCLAEEAAAARGAAPLRARSMPVVMVYPPAAAPGPALLKLGAELLTLLPSARPPPALAGRADTPAAWLPLLDAALLSSAAAAAAVAAAWTAVACCCRCCWPLFPLALPQQTPVYGRLCGAPNEPAARLDMSTAIGAAPGMQPVGLPSLKTPPPGDWSGCLAAAAAPIGSGLPDKPTGAPATRGPPETPPPPPAAAPAAAAPAGDAALLLLRPAWSPAWSPAGEGGRGL